MNNNFLGTSEQALDDYFTQLLGDELVSAPEPEKELELVQSDAQSDTQIEAKAESKLLEPVKVDELGPELQPKSEPIQEESIALYPVVREVEVPLLEDVQKLLDQISSRNVADEPEIESIIEQNTVQIGLEKEAIQSKAESIEESTAVVEEIATELETLADITSIDSEVIEIKPELIDEVEVDTSIASAQQLQSASEESWSSSQRNEAFQVLYFEVHGVMFAVPLDELGGIHRVEELSHLIGRPDWYLGLQTSRENQLDVVDTARWVMPEKLQDDSYKESYQYIVMLGLSTWGLASSQLKGTELVELDAVRWREKAGKRPWLAGMVKEKMCALVHVEALIEMLKSGLDAQALNG